MAAERTRGQRLRDYRTSRGVRQEDLAACLGVHKSTISRMERGGIQIQRESDLIRLFAEVQRIFEERLTPAEVLDE